MESFADVFDQTTLRTMVGPEMDIQLKEGAQPFYVSGSRPIPIPLRAEVKRTLDEQEAKGIIAKVDIPTEWSQDRLRCC